MKKDEKLVDVLGLGKVCPEVMRRSVFPFLSLDDEPTLDGGAVTLSGRTVVAHSPSIGVPLYALGFFAFHYAASNVAARMARPRHLVVGIYLPLKTAERDLRTIVKGLGEEARKYGVTVVAGQTAAYYGLEIPLVTATCLGEPVRQTVRPQPGDRILIVGAVGGEAVWLKALPRGESGGGWREFTPLEAAIRLQGVDGVRLMHDVSEGGVKKALLEVAEATDLRMEVDSAGICYAEGVELLGRDALRAPTYGALIVVAAPQAVGEVDHALRELGVPFASVGVLKEGSGVFIDGEEVGDLGRTALDEIYGSFEEQDEILNVLREAVSLLEEHDKAAALIPQVGTNLVFAKPGASSLDDVAGLSGRVVRSMGRPMACGKVAYGGSEHMASVVLEAMKLNPRIRASINIRAGDDVTQALKEMGLSPRSLPSGSTDDVCPVATDIKRGGLLFQAYHHPGSFGVEPTTTLLGEEPMELVETVVELARRV